MMDIHSFDWKSAAPVILAIGAAFRISWFVRQQKSWELLFLGLFLTIAASVNLAQKNEWLHLNQTFVIGTAALAILMTFEPEFHWLIGNFVRNCDSHKIIKGKMLDEILAGAQILAHTKTGALIAFERDDNLTKLAQSGTAINSDVKKELLTALFSKDSLTHDGGAIVRNGRIAYVSVIFPITFNLDIDKNLGTRHRAAIGLTEQTDAVCLVVSEEEGTISLAKDGEIFYNLDQKNLRKHLSKCLAQKSSKRVYPFHRLRTFRRVESSTAFLRFLKSFPLQSYDLVFLIFYLLLTASLFAARGISMNQESLQQFLSAHPFLLEPWYYLPFALAMIHVIFFLVRSEMTFDQIKAVFTKETGLLFIPLRAVKRPAGECVRVYIKRESQKAPLWSLFLEDKRGKKIKLDSAGSPNGLFRDAKQIHEFLKIELVNQS